MEEIKDLGGLVNKDIAFNKLPENAVYDSQNFRVVTNEGASSGARENVKGTIEIASIESAPCLKTITFDVGILNTELTNGNYYIISVLIGSSTVVDYIFQYTNVIALINGFALFLKTQNLNAVTTNNVITLNLPNCEPVEILRFEDSSAPGGGPPVIVNQAYPFTPVDPKFSYNFTNPPEFNEEWYPNGPFISFTGSPLGTAFSNWLYFPPPQGSSLLTPIPILDELGVPVIPSTRCLKINVVSRGPGGAHSIILQGDNSYRAAPPAPNGVFNGTIVSNPTHGLKSVGYGPFTSNLNYYVVLKPYTEIEINVYLYFGNFAVINPTYQSSLFSIINPSYHNSQSYLKVATFTDVNNTANAVSYNYLTSTRTDIFTLPTGVQMSDLVSHVHPASLKYRIEIKSKPTSGNLSAVTDYTIYFTRFNFTKDVNSLVAPIGSYLSSITTNTLISSSNTLAGRIIGWTTLRDDIYLITTNGFFNPDIPATIPVTPTTGQIWKLSYNKAGDYSDPANYQLTLVHSSGLNLTTTRPIANPGMIEARYENKDVQKIYWTDNYNVPRQINVANIAAALVLTPEQLNLQPSLSMDMPMIVEVLDGGSLKVGVYQVAYRLKNINGAESRFSRTSNSIPIIDAAETGATVENYFPSAAVQEDANKSIRVLVENIDQTYDVIEFVTLYYYDNSNNPDIYIVKELPITSPKLEIIISGDEVKVPINVNEFTAFNTYIKRCKTLAATKQTLFLGNITVANQDINFDARAYRFPHPNNPTGNGLITYLEDNTGVYTPLHYANGQFLLNNVLPVPEDADAIQSYTNQGPGYIGSATDFLSNYLYQPGTNILGGAGPNVKYEFVTTDIILDTKVPNSYTAPGYTWPTVQTPTSGPHYITSTNSSVTFNSLDRVYQSQRPSRSDFASPYTYDIYVGYRRDEMYRFGIVFFDELDNPTYVKWIADIRMPHIYMPDNGQTFTSAPASGMVGAGLSRSRQIPVNSWPVGLNSPQINANEFSSDPIYYQPGYTTTVGGNTFNLLPTLYGKPLGIKFTIDFSSVPNKYKRAAIVRVPLEEQDKHIYGQGLFLPTYASSGVNTGTYQDNNTVFLGFPQSHNTDYFGVATANRTIYDCWTFRSPEHLFKRNFGFSGGDYIDIVNFLHPNFTYPFGLPTPAVAVGADSDVQTLYHKNSLGTFVNSEGSSPLNLGWVNSAGVGDMLKLIGVKIKYYVSYEYESFINASIPTSSVRGVNALAPNSIKATLANGVTTATNQTRGPYPIKTAIDVKAGSGNRDYIKGNISTTTGIKTIHGCSPKNLNNITSFGGGSGAGIVTRPDIAPATRSYVNDCLFIQLEAWNAENFSDSIGNFLAKDSWYTTNITVRGWGQYLANYVRSVPGQYGGSSYVARTNNEYILCNNLIDISNKTTPINTIVYGGDTVISVMDHVLEFPDRLEMATAPIGAVAGGKNMLYKVGYIPVETNVALEYRRNFNNTKLLNHQSGVPNRVQNLEYTEPVINSTYWEDPNDLKIEAYEHFEVDPVFNHSPKSVYRFFPKPYNVNFQDTFDCRIIKSETKTDGELTESWSIFKTDAKLDVESAYGPVNNLVIFQNKLYYFQDKAFGILQVNEQKLISDSLSNADLILGNSGILERYDYISTKTGTKHQFSMHVSDYSIVWFDVLARKMYRYKPGALEPLSDIKGLNALLYNKTSGFIQTRDNPYLSGGIHSTYDYRHNEFYMTIYNTVPYANTPFGQDLSYLDTLVYNELLDGYIGSYTHYPKVYINDKINIFGVVSKTGGINGVDAIHIHNYGPYGIFYGGFKQPSKVSFVVNSNPVIEKTFTNLELIAEAYGRQDYGMPSTEPYQDYSVETDPIGFNPGPSTKRMNYQYAPLITNLFYDVANNSSLRFYNTYQNTDWVPMNKIGRKHKTIWNIKVPSDMVIGQNPTLSIFNQSNLLLPVTRPKFTRRLKDKWFIVDFSYDNASDHRLVVHSAKAIYTPNSR